MSKFVVRVGVDHFHWDFLWPESDPLGCAPGAVPAEFEYEEALARVSVMREDSRGCCVNFEALVLPARLYRENPTKWVGRK